MSVTRTRFIYASRGGHASAGRTPAGSEDGLAVGLINYPRFPYVDPAGEVRAHALRLASLLLQAMGQERVSVVFADTTVMLEASAELAAEPEEMLP